MHSRNILQLLAAALLIGLFALPLRAQETPSSSAPADSAADSAAAADDEPRGSLAEQQDALAMRYRRFEKTLTEMYEYMLKTDPERADLLRRAIVRSGEDAIARQMDVIALSLKGNEYGSAVERQEVAITHLKSLLDLLQSEDRKKQNRAEQERIADLIKDVQRLIGKEKDARAANERGVGTERVADQQGKVADETKKLGEKIDSQDRERNAKAGEGKPGEGKPGEGKPGEGKPGEGKPGEGKPGEGKPEEGQPGDSKPEESQPGEGKPEDAKPGEGKPGEGKPGEGKPGESKPGEGKPGEGQPGEGQPGEGQPGEGQPGEGQPGQKQNEPSTPDPNSTPGRQEIERAHREMERAIEELKKQNRDGASNAQDEAIAELIKAKEKLEEILRQLREEEKELLLAALEARFQKMLQLQLIVYNGTVNLGKVQGEWESKHYGRSKELSIQEDEIALEAAKALTLLREEGSSVAFPEAVEQLRADILTVVGLLQNNNAGELTQSIEKDIIEALQELIEALQKEMEKNKDNDMPPGDMPPGQPQDPALVDKLAELKMLRSLQFRVNRRTKQLGRQIDGEQATEAEILEQLRGLSQRQARIQQATYDLATGRNQ